MPREIARTADRNVALATSGKLDPRTVVVCQRFMHNSKKYIKNA